VSEVVCVGFPFLQETMVVHMSPATILAVEYRLSESTNGCFYSCRRIFSNIGTHPDLIVPNKNKNKSKKNQHKNVSSCRRDLQKKEGKQKKLRDVIFFSYSSDSVRVVLYLLSTFKYPENQDMEDFQKRYVR